MARKHDGVYLDRLEYGQEQVVLDMIKSDKELRATFGGGDNTISRLVNSDYTALVMDDEETVGFVMVVLNGRTRKYEVDLGILSKYRGQGYGSLAVGIIKDIILANKLEVEIQIKKVNIRAIKSVIKNGFVLSREDKECNYYKLPDSGVKRGR